MEKRLESKGICMVEIVFWMFSRGISNSFWRKHHLLFEEPFDLWFYPIKKLFNGGDKNK